MESIASALRTAWYCLRGQVSRRPAPEWALWLTLPIAVGLLYWAQAGGVPAALEQGACVIRPAAPRLDLHPCTVTHSPLPDGGWHERIDLMVPAPEMPARGGQAQAYRLWLGVTEGAHRLRVEQRSVTPHAPPSTAQELLELAMADPFDARPVASPRILVPVVLTPGRHQIDLFYRLHLNGKVQARLYSPAGAEAFGRVDAMGMGGLLGLMGALCVVALVMAWLGRQWAQLWYGLMVLTHAALLAAMGGYGFAMLWPEQAHWNLYAEFLIASLVLLCHLLFVMDFFQLRQRYRRLWRWHLLGLVLALGNAALTLVNAAMLPLTTLALGLAYVPLVVLTGGLALRDRLAGAAFYLLGHLLMVVFHPILFGLSQMGLNPLPGVDVLLYPRVGVVLEMVFFSAALVARARRFKAWQREQRQRQWSDAQALVSSEQQRLAAQEQVQRKRLDLASASHDMAQSLATLRMVAQALHDWPHTAKEAATLERTVAQAQALLHGLMARERGEHLRGHHERLLLGDVLAQVADELRPTAQAKGLRVDWVDSSALLRVSPLLLLRVLRNLATNAVRYTPRGRVLLGARRRPGGVEIQVLDTGPGLPAPLVQALHQPFAQGHNASPEGYGLGLFIVRTLCQESGWRLRVQTQPGRGSCFAVWVPLEAGGVAAGEAENTEEV